jgi:hypothetical protein
MVTARQVTEVVFMVRAEDPAPCRRVPWVAADKEDSKIDSTNNGDLKK